MQCVCVCVCTNIHRDVITDFHCSPCYSYVCVCVCMSLPTAVQPVNRAVSSVCGSGADQIPVLWSQWQIVQIR